MRKLGLHVLVFWFVFLSLSTVSSVFAQSGPPKKTVLIMNYTLAGRHVPFFAGIEKGFYKDAGFDVDVLPSTGSGFVLTTVDSGRADFGISESTALVQTVAKGAKVQAFQAFFDEFPNGLATLKPIPSIKAVYDLKIGSSAQSATRWSTMPIIMEINGLDPQKLQWTIAAATSLIPLLVNGQIDAIGASIDSDVPILEKLLKPEGRQVYYSRFTDWGYDVLGVLFVTTTERIARNPEEVKRFAKATRQSITFAMKEPETATDLMLKTNRTLDRETTLIQWRHSIEGIETPYMKKHGLGAITPDRVQRTIDLTKKAFTIDREVTPAQIYATGFDKD